jgi:hypothetical protein
MVKFIKCGLLALLLLSVLAPTQMALADIGPKPTMEFRFVQDFIGPPVTITAGTMFECDQSDCSDAKPLERLGPQGFNCEAAACSSMAYGYSTYHRLSIQFSDGVTRESNVFTHPQFNTNYEVKIRQTDLLVTAKWRLNLFSPDTILILCGLGLLLGIALIIVVVVLLVRRARKK